MSKTIKFKLWKWVNIPEWWVNIKQNGGSTWSGIYSQWENGLLTVEAWLSFVEEVRNKINKYGKRLHTHSRLFADQLFDGYVALYMVHCMTLYTTVRKHSNPKFTLAIDLLFNS